MRTVSTIALGLALALGAAAAPALAKDKPAKAAPAKFTPAVQTSLAAAQKAIADKDFVTAAAKVNEARPAVTTDDDRNVFGSIEYQVGKSTDNQAMIRDGIDMMIASGKASPENLPLMLLAQGQLAYQAKDYQKAAASLQAAQKAGASDPVLVPMIVDSINLGGQPAQALAMLNELIARQKATGQTIPVEWYQRGISIGYGTKGENLNNPAMQGPTLQLVNAWIASYPTKGNWQDAINIYSRQVKASGEMQTDAYRLARAVGSLSGIGDYLDYANNVYLRYPQEALSVLNEGTAKGVIPATSKDANEIANLVKPKIAADKASLAASDKSARTAPNGRGALNTADAYAGYGEYAKAIELYKVALEKGGIDAPTANLRLGAAQALSGDAAGARTSFAGVTGPRKALADFWIIHLDHPTVG